MRKTRLDEIPNQEVQHPKRSEVVANPQPWVEEAFGLIEDNEEGRKTFKFVSRFCSSKIRAVNISIICRSRSDL